MLERKGATEAAAFRFVGMHHDIDRRQLVEQRARVHVRAHLAASGTRGVQGNPLARPAVAEADPRHLEQELRQLVHAIGKRLRFGLQERVIGEHLRVMVAHRAGAGTRRDDHRPRLGKQPQLGECHRARLVGEAAAVRRLPAAGLVGGKKHLDPFPLEQPDGVEASLRAEQIDETGSEKVHPGRLLGIPAALSPIHGTLLRKV
jgi:hypothetical protein